MTVLVNCILLAGFCVLYWLVSYFLLQYVSVRFISFNTMLSNWLVRMSHFTHSLRLLNSNLLASAIVCTSFGSCSFSVAAHKIWNSPTSLKMCHFWYFSACSLRDLAFWPLCLFINYIYLLTYFIKWDVESSSLWCNSAVLSKDGSEFAGSVFHRINSRLETAVHIDWTVASSETKFGVGAKYCPDRDTTLRVCISANIDHD